MYSGAYLFISEIRVRDFANDDRTAVILWKVDTTVERTSHKYGCWTVEITINSPLSIFTRFIGNKAGANVFVRFSSDVLREIVRDCVDEDSGVGVLGCDCIDSSRKDWVSGFLCLVCDFCDGV